jgi:hypothetical protein
MLPTASCATQTRCYSEPCMCPSSVHGGTITARLHRCVLVIWQRSNGQLGMRREQQHAASGTCGNVLARRQPATRASEGKHKYNLRLCDVTSEQERQSHSICPIEVMSRQQAASQGHPNAHRPHCARAPFHTGNVCCCCVVVVVQGGRTRAGVLGQEETSCTAGERKSQAAPPPGLQGSR